MRAFIIGDVHGCYDQLIKLLDLVKVYDELIFVGDLIDRGPEVKKTVDYVIDLKEKMGDRLHYLWGNHEYEWVHWKDQYYKGELSEEYKKKFVEICEPYYSCEDFAIVHGGCEKEEDLNNWDIRDLIWDRDGFRCGFYEGKFMIVGHTPLTTASPVYICDNRHSEINSEIPLPKRGIMNIDTGCVFGGPLSGVVIDTETKKMWTRSVK